MRGKIRFMEAVNLRGSPGPCLRDVSCFPALEYKVRSNNRSPTLPVEMHKGM